MALASGVAWSAALTGLRRLHHLPDVDRALACYLLVALVFLPVSLVPGGREMALPTAAQVLPVLGVALLLAAVWLLPVVWATVHAAERLDPGRLSVILMLEILVGIVSAALLADEIPGAPEMTGMACIVAALGSELLPARRPALVRQVRSASR